MTEPEREKSPKIAETVAVVGVMVSILVAGTTLLSNSGNLPSWWFDFSLILLIALACLVPIMIFTRPLPGRIKQRLFERKLDRISRKYTPMLKDLLVRSRRFDDSLRALIDNMRRHYENDIKGQLAAYALESCSNSQVKNATYEVEKEIDESDGKYRSFCLLMKRFEWVLDTYKKGSKTYEVFAHEIMTTTEKPITKGLEADYEAFREKYNDFLNDVTDFCHKINQETGRFDFPEYSFEYLKRL